MLEIARRAKLRLSVQNEQTPRQLPPKFAIPLLERASLESIDDDKLIDMWANLLATASSQEVEMISQYIGILGGITSNQVRILDEMLTSPNLQKVDVHMDAYDYLNPDGFFETLGGLEEYSTSEDVAEKIWEEISFVGVAVDCITVSSGAEHDDATTVNPEGSAYSDDRYFDFQNLVRLGVLDQIKTRMRRVGRFTIDLYFYVVTPVGADLFACCNPDKMQRYNRTQLSAPA